MVRFVVTGAVTGTLYGLIAMGLVVVYRGAKVFNFAHGEIGMIGAFVFIELWADGRWPLLVAAALGLATSGAAGLAVERLVVRPLSAAPRVHLMAATIAVSGVLLSVAAQVWGLSVRVLPQPLAGPPVRLAGAYVSRWQVAVLVVGTAIALACRWFFERAELGLAMRASAEHPDALRLQGFDPRRVSAATWLLGSLLAGSAAILIAPTGAVHPGFMFLLLVPALAGALVGGIESPLGAWAGGVLVGVAESVITMKISVAGLPQALLFVVIAATLVLRPQGLFAARLAVRSV